MKMLSILSVKMMLKVTYSVGEPENSDNCGNDQDDRVSEVYLSLFYYCSCRIFFPSKLTPK